MRALVFILIAGVIAAQPQPPSRDVAALLASEKASDVAWGARLTEYRQRDQLIGLLNHSNAAVRATALDRLVDLQASVPSTVLEPLVRAGNDNAQILIGLHPRDHVTLIHQMLDESLKSQGQWLILTSILHGLSPPGHASRLMRQWTMTVYVIVSDSGKAEEPLPRNSVADGVCIDTFTFGPPSEYPPLPSNVIQAMRLGSKVLALGPHPLSYGPDTCIMGMSGFSRDDYRFDFLKDLAKEYAPVPEGHIRYRTAAQYRQDAAAVLARTRKFVQGLRAKLVANGKLAADDPAWPKLNVQVEDQRANRSKALPQIDWKF